MRIIKIYTVRGTIYNVMVGQKNKTMYKKDNLFPVQTNFTVLMETPETYYKPNLWKKSLYYSS